MVTTARNSKTASRRSATRTTDDPNKAQLIRDAFTKLGIDASAKDVQAEYPDIVIAPAQISNVRTKEKEKSAGGGKGAKGPKNRLGPITADELLEARPMIEKIGGLDRAIKLMKILTDLNLANLN